MLWNVSTLLKVRKLLIVAYLLKRVNENESVIENKLVIEAK